MLSVRFQKKGTSGGPYENTPTDKPIKLPPKYGG